MKNIVIALALTGTALTPAALADTDFPFVFQYDQADLQTYEGASTVYDRLVTEVEAACEDMAYGTRGLENTRLQRQCFNAAMEDVNAELSARAPLFTQIVADHNS